MTARLLTALAGFAWLAVTIAALGFGPKCEHAWRTVGYGGAGWYLLRCDECGAEEIG